MFNWILNFRKDIILIWNLSEVVPTSSIPTASVTSGYHLYGDISSCPRQLYFYAQVKRPLPPPQDAADELLTELPPIVAKVDTSLSVLLL